jgi:hypothetical protein
MKWKITLKEIGSGKVLAESVVPKVDEEELLNVFWDARRKTGGKLPPYQLDVRHA